MRSILLMTAVVLGLACVAVVASWAGASPPAVASTSPAPRSPPPTGSSVLPVHTYATGLNAGGLPLTLTTGPDDNL